MTIQNSLKLTLLAICVVAVTACDDESEWVEMEVESSQNAIYHGEDSNEPTVVKVSSAHGVCSGTAISKRVVLTAGHCFDGLSFSNDSASLSVTFTFVDGSTKTEQCVIERYPGYSGTGYRDLAMIRLSKNVFNKTARIWDDKVYTGMRLDIFGYGHIWNSGTNPGTQHTGDDFAQIRVDELHDTYFRSKGRTARTCRGDSGGPASRMTELNGATRPAVVGVISSSAKLDGNCTKSKKKMTMPRVAPRLSWIEQRGFLDCRRTEAPNGYVQVCTDVIPDAGGAVSFVNPAGFTVNRHNDENKNDGTINLWQNTGHISQDWILASDGAIHSASHAGYCLNIHNYDISNGAKINLWECNGHASQRWTKSGNNIKSTFQPGYCLNLHNYDNSNGATINLWQCNGHNSQKWYNG